MPSLENRVVLITGPARNIGRAVARKLAAEGAELVLAGLQFDLVEQLRDELGGRTLAIETDVTDEPRSRPPAPPPPPTASGASTRWCRTRASWARAVSNPPRPR